MAVIQRPAKQGNATTYQGKVALGYTTILAGEVDADLDTMYAAWNGGVDAVNIAPNSISADKLQSNIIGPRELADDLPGSVLVADAITSRELAPDSVGTAELQTGAVTYAKLAPNAQLWSDDGTSLYAVSGRIVKTNSESGYGSFHAATGANTTRILVPGGLTANYYIGPGGWTRDDTSKTGWLVKLDPPTDGMGFYRDTGTQTRPFWMDGGGNAEFSGRLRHRAFTSALTGSSAHPVVAGQTLTILYQQVFWDSGGQTAPNPSPYGYLYSPGFYELVIVWAYVNFDNNGGFGCQLSLEYSPDNGASWASLGYRASPDAKTLNLMMLCPASPNTVFRSRFLNASGVNPVNIFSRTFAMCGLGVW
jgi:hypothetical protein